VALRATSGPRAEGAQLPQPAGTRAGSFMAPGADDGSSPGQSHQAACSSTSPQPAGGLGAQPLRRRGRAARRPLASIWRWQAVARAVVEAACRQAAGIPRAATAHWSCCSATRARDQPAPAPGAPGRPLETGDLPQPVGSPPGSHAGSRGLYHRPLAGPKGHSSRTGLAGRSRRVLPDWFEWNPVPIPPRSGVWPL